ncbi:MAG: hypothetical protein QOF19_3260, partial [Alphaproteobacteria bacterium]|nr:hypothetical protein [Alphaproteobacteria bacterium]
MKLFRTISIVAFAVLAAASAQAQP